MSVTFRERQSSIFHLLSFYLTYFFFSQQPTSAGLDSTVMDDMKLAVRDMDTGSAVSFRPPVRNSSALSLLLLVQA